MTGIGYKITKGVKRLFFLIILSLFFQFKGIAQFKSGHYYTKDGTKVTGLLRFNYGSTLLASKAYGDCSVIFKTEKKGKKIEFKTNEICCFVIENDSFAIIKNFKPGKLITYPQDFAKVLQSGRINLYHYYTMVGSGNQYGATANTVKTWIIEKDGKADKLTLNKFYELMPLYLADFPILLEKVNTMQLNYYDAEQVIKMYNDFWKNNGDL